MRVDYCRLLAPGGSERGTCECTHPLQCRRPEPPGVDVAFEDLRRAAVRSRRDHRAGEFAAIAISLAFALGMILCEVLR